MKKGASPIGGEYFSFGTDNKLRIFPPNTFKFKPRDHIALDEIQKCILDNFWFQYNNKREDRGYMLNQEFILVYIDDLLIFSKSYKEHIAHLEIFFRKVEQHGLILSKRKMEICKEKINFLGHEIGDGKIHLQDHIAKKILQFPDVMNDKKTLQQFLGIVNYARNYIENLAKLAGPLYAKLRKNGCSTI